MNYDMMDHLLARIHLLYQRPGGYCGCCTHIVTDDMNIEDRHIDFCIKYAEKESCWECWAIMKDMRPLTRVERCRVVDPNGIYYDHEGNPKD
jgi:hypothetical protein